MVRALGALICFFASLQAFGASQQEKSPLRGNPTMTIGLKGGYHVTLPVSARDYQRLSGNVNPDIGMLFRYNRSSTTLWDFNLQYMPNNFTTEYKTSHVEFEDYDKNQVLLSCFMGGITYNRILSKNFIFSMGTGLSLLNKAKVLYSGSRFEHEFAEETYNVQDSFHKVIPFLLAGVGYQVRRFIPGAIIKMDILFCPNILSEPFTKMNAGFEGIGGLWVFAENFSLANVMLSMEMPLLKIRLK